MSTSDKIAIIAAIIAGASFWMSWLAYRFGKVQAERSLRRDQSSGEIELFGLWEGVRLIHKTQPATPQMVRAHKALVATARRWVDDPQQRPVIKKNFLSDYVAVYESMRDCVAELPGIGKKPSTYLTDEMDIAYGEMTSSKE